METKGGLGATQNESRQDPCAPGVEYGLCPGPRVPTDDEMLSLSLCICVPRAISLTLGHQNILSSVALFVCTSLMGMAVFVLGVFVLVLAPCSLCRPLPQVF